MKKQSQTTRLLELLSDGKDHSTIDIMEKVYGAGHLGLARVGSRICDLRQSGHEIVGWKDKTNPSIYWYRMVIKRNYCAEVYRPEVLAIIESNKQLSLV
jgi:hypothetical protein